MRKTRLRVGPALVGIIASVVALAAGPALADRINKCSKIERPGFYLLTRNLRATGDCLVVAADFVTLDLGGWIIAGAGSAGSGITDRGKPRLSIAVRNGTVAGFADAAVSLGSTSGAVVEKVRAIGLAGGSVVANQGIVVGADSTVSGNIVHNTFSTGISAGPGGTVSNNNVAGSLEDSISVGPHSIVSGNIIRSTNIGIIASDSIVSGNTILGGAQFGIEAGGTISGNTVEGATAAGIIASPGSTVSGNTVKNTEASGIVVSCPSNVMGNTSTNSVSGPNLELVGDGCTNVDNLAP